MQRGYMKLGIRKLDLNQLILYILLLGALYICVMTTISVEHQITWLIYIGIISGVVLISYINTNRKKQSILLYIFMVCFITFPIGTRCDMAMDDYNYKNIFNNLLNSDWLYCFTREEEIGFLLFEKLLSVFIDDYYWVQLLLFLCSNLILAKGLHNFSRIINISFFYLCYFLDLYFKFMSAGLNRMYIAMVTMVYGYWFMYKKKPLTYILITIVASMFHRSSLFCLIFIPLAIPNEKIKIKKWKSKYFLMVSMIIPTLTFLLSWIAGFLGERYSGYVSSPFKIDIGITTFIRIFFITFLFFARKKIKIGQREFYNNALFVSWVGVILDIFVSQNALGRVIYYTDLLLIIICSMNVNDVKFSLKKVMYNIMMGIYFISIFYVTIIRVERYYNSLFPFHTFLRD